MSLERPLWFKRKKYGYGWTPCTWQGWLVIFIYLGGIILLANKFFPESSASSPNRFFVVCGIWTIILLVITYRTGPSPRWQWGESDDVEDEKSK